MKAFKAYDFRGVYGKDFTRDDVRKIGYFLPQLLNTQTILVGRDVRTSSDEIFEALCEGINDQGADVHSIGLATTPMVYYATAALGYDGSVQITASHNPKQYNGLKISRTGALPVGSESGLKELERMVTEDPVIPKQGSQRGSVSMIEIKDTYIDFLRTYTPDITNLRLTVDCSNGMANLLVKDLLGTIPDYLYDTLDGTFPNHEPNPLEEENVVDLIRAVKSSGSDLGIIFDGDADRVMFVDDTGRFVQPDIITAVLGEYFLKKHGPGTVLQDIRTSRSTTEHLERLGATVYTGKVGHSFAKMKMREMDAIFGGELAGHYYFRDFYNCDSGMLACLIVLQVMKDLHDQGRTFSSLIDAITVYATSGEMNFKIENKEGAIKALVSTAIDEATPSRVLDIDGYRVEFPDWWFNVRQSNTEPYLRLVVEAKTESLLNERILMLKGVLSPFL